MDLAAGLAGFLGREWGGPVTVSGLAASSAGARRANVAFDAETADGGRRRQPLLQPPQAVRQRRAWLEQPGHDLLQGGQRLLGRRARTKVQ